MDQLADFETLGEYAVFRPSGEASLEQATEMVASAISRARAQSIRKLLVITLGWQALNSPNVADRYFMVQRWAIAAAGAVKVAIVARPDLIDPEKFGVKVARNSGLCAEIFASEPEAVLWLKGISNPGRTCPSGRTGFGAHGKNVCD